MVETDYVIELLLDVSPLSAAERRWLLKLRGQWLTPSQRHELSVLQHKVKLHELHGPMESY